MSWSASALQFIQNWMRNLIESGRSVNKHPLPYIHTSIEVFRKEKECVSVCTRDAGTSSHISMNCRLEICASREHLVQIKSPESSHLTIIQTWQITCTRCLLSSDSNLFIFPITQKPIATWYWIGLKWTAIKRGMLVCVSKFQLSTKSSLSVSLQTQEPFAESIAF